MVKYEFFFLVFGDVLLKIKGLYVIVVESMNIDDERFFACIACIDC